MNRPICIIDDDEDVRAVMCYALEFENIQTMPLENGLLAIEFLSKLPEYELPCFIIVDYMMPEMNGIEFIKTLREDYPETLGKIPVALSTARIPDKNEYELENVQLLTKPIDLPDLISTVSEYYHGSNSDHPARF